MLSEEHSDESPFARAHRTAMQQLADTLAKHEDDAIRYGIVCSKPWLPPPPTPRWKKVTSAMVWWVIRRLYDLDPLDLNRDGDDFDY